MPRNFFLHKNSAVWDNIEKCGGAREAADDMDTRCMLDK